ncbi:YqcC family protein [Shewanella sp.]|jgi:uncharacterized protein YqcC (DUF446 family)|uniref:YqcC family protein n=1 Tax=Shewanella sp. TaxID=50422 RepID=UPI004047C397
MLYLASKNHLITLEQLLKQCQLWSDTPPSASALASNAPFACDTMTFEQWLQFIFIPKMTELIYRQQPLPSSMAIAPMAEQLWQGMAQRQSVINHLRAFDALLNQQ